MLFANLSSEGVDSLKSKYREVAEQYKGQGIGFLLGDVEASQAAFQVNIYSNMAVCLLHFLLKSNFSVGWKTVLWSSRKPSTSDHHSE